MARLSDPISWREAGDCVLIVGIPGSGKSLLGEIIAEQYGGFGAQPENHAAEVDQEVLDSDFNEWRIGKQFILGNEMLSTDRRQDQNRVKNLITARTFVANHKYGLKYPLRAIDNFYLTSNDRDALSIDDSDRRWFVWHTTTKLDSKVGAEIAKWARSSEGKGALRHYLLNIDTSDFDPHGRPPGTEAREDMIEDGYSDLERWLKEHFIREKVEPTSDNEHSLEWLAKEHSNSAGRPTSTKAVSNALHRAGATKIRARPGHTI